MDDFLKEPLAEVNGCLTDAEFFSVILRAWDSHEIDWDYDSRDLMRAIKARRDGLAPGAGYQQSREDAE